MTAYRFDDVRVDVGSFRVERGGEVVPLEPKAFDLLVLLIERRGQVVTKPEILDTVWRQTAVTDNALTRIVAHLRKALGDDARDARYIETVPTRGYRWLAPVEREDPAAASAVAAPARPAAPPPRPHSWPWSWRAASVALAIVLATAAVLGLARRRVQGRAPEPMRMDSLWPTQVTVSPGLDAFPALSPDGASIAYVSDRTGAFEISIKSIAASARELALTSDGQQNVEPAWSPDGQFIAYHSMVRGGVWVVPALGGVPRRVTDFGSRPAWSPDGRRVAFQSDPLVAIGPGQYGANAPSTIWVVDVDGGHLRRLTSPGRPAGGHAAPVWSPAGARIGFVSYSALPSQLWHVPAEGGAPALVFQGSVPVYDPVFARDGGSVYFATGGPFLMQVPLSPETGLAAGPPVAIATPALANPLQLSISGDGKRLALAGVNLVSNLWSAPVTPSTGLLAGEERPITQDTLRRKSTPLFSPDGRWIAFTAARVGSGTDIWVMGADGASTPLTATDPAAPKPARPSYFRPSWFPDSARVAFVANDGSRAELLAADLIARRPEPLLEVHPSGSLERGGREDTIGALDARLSADGTAVGYSQIDASTGRSGVRVRPLRGGEVRRLTTGDESESYPVWSPDGRWIATEVRDDHGTAIAVRPSSGGALRRLTGPGGQDWLHSWFPDSDRIVFAGLRGGVWNLWWVSASTGREVQVTKQTRPGTFVRYPAWSPRGDRVVYERGELRGNIWIAQVPTEVSTGEWRPVRVGR